MTEYERGYRDGIEAAAGMAEACGSFGGEFDWIANQIRSLSPAPATPEVSRPVTIRAEVRQDGRIVPLVDQDEFLLRSGDTLTINLPPYPLDAPAPTAEQGCPVCRGGEVTFGHVSPYCCPRCGGTGKAGA